MKHNNSFGFTLIETIIAVAILSVVSVPIAGIFIQTSKIDSKARMMQKATDLAQNIMESIREYSMTEIVEQCMDANNVSLVFLEECLPDYKPTTYKSVSAGQNLKKFEENVIGNLTENSIIGEVGVPQNGQTVVSAIKGLGELRFAFLGIEYNSSTFDAVVCFDIVKDATDTTGTTEEYYLYDVEVIVYQSVAGSHFESSARLAKVKGAVINKTDDVDTYVATTITPCENAYTSTGNSAHFKNSNYNNHRVWYPNHFGKIYWDYDNQKWYYKKQEITDTTGFPDVPEWPADRNTNNGNNNGNNGNSGNNGNNGNSNGNNGNGNGNNKK